MWSWKIGGDKQEAIIKGTVKAMVTKLASGELVFSSSLATGLTILLKLAEINTCFNGNAALGKHNNFHTSYNLFFQQNKCFKMLALFPFPSHSNWWLCVQLLASMFSFRRNATLSINSFQLLVSFCMLCMIISFLTCVAEHHRQLNVVTKLFGKP